MQFVDRVLINVESGSGGDGMVAWRREKFVSHGGPAGGDGGDGGDVVIEATADLHTLLDFKYQSQFKAMDGDRGRPKNQHGRSGKDIVIRVPCGTLIRDTQTKQIIADLVKPEDKIIVAFGGRGGRGNSRFTSSRRQAPQFSEPGEPGIQRELELELKLIADVGLIGMPNAGKSTLISVISAAKPKIADYPFTTLTPNLGVVKKPTGDGIVVADIPGLIEGASEGVGLGLSFLRHVERTRLLLHLVDCSGVDVDSVKTPLETMHLINRELQKYDEQLSRHPQMILLTKIDALPDRDVLLPQLLEMLGAACPGSRVMAISALTHEGITPLLNAMFEFIETHPPLEMNVEIVPDEKAFDHDDSAFEIHRTGKVVTVVGGKLERLVRVTDLRNHSATRRMLNIFKAMGVYRALEKAGVKSGQTVIIGGMEFEYTPEAESKP